MVALWGASPAQRSALVQHGSGITTAHRDGYGAEAIYDSIDVAGSGYSLAGKRWRCEELTRKIAIREEARVVFQAQLIDILK